MTRQGYLKTPGQPMPQRFIARPTPWHDAWWTLFRQRLDCAVNAFRRCCCPWRVYDPKSKFRHTMAKFEKRPKAVRSKLLGVLNRRLFHRCMEIVTRSLRRTEPHDAIDPEGNIRSVRYEFAAYIADLGDAECRAPRTPSDILRKIKEIKKNHKTAYGHSPSLEEFMNLAGEHHLNGVDKPFWRTLRRLNIFEALSPDLRNGTRRIRRTRALAAAVRRRPNFPPRRVSYIADD